MAKATKAGSQAAPRARRTHRDDSERTVRLLVIGGVIAVVLIALGVIAYGWYDTEIRPLGKTVLSVGDIKFSLGHLERRMKPDVEGQTNPQLLLALPDSVLDQLQREALMIQGAPTLGIEVTEEDVTAEIRQRGGLADDVEPGLYAAEFRRQVEESGLHEGEYRQMLLAQLVEGKLRDYFLYLLPPTEPQVRARYIVTDNVENADTAVARLDAGEDYEAVAGDLSLAGSTQLGDVEWQPRGGSSFVPEDVESFFFEAEPGAHSDVIESNGYFYVGQLIERDDNRTLEATQKPDVAARDLDEWLKGLPETIEVKRDFTRDDAVRALEDLL